MDANPLPNPDHDWTVVNFPGTLPLAGLAADDQPDLSAGAVEENTDLLRPVWSEPLPLVRGTTPPAADLPSASRLDSGSAARSRLVDVAQLVATAEALQQENAQLRQQVDRLEAAVTECRAVLELQQMRSQTQQSLYEARSRDLEVACQEAQQRVTELTAAHEALTQYGVEQADWTQQQQQADSQLANLERSCALLQERCLHQSDQLNQSRQTVQDLRDRLERQQRQTLQLRAALEQCLERDYRRGESATGLSVIVDHPLADDYAPEQPDSTELTSEPIAPPEAIDPLPPAPPAIAETSADSSADSLAPAELPTPIAAALETIPGTEAIRTEDILALLNWDLSPQTAPSYRIAPTRSLGSHSSQPPQSEHDRADQAAMDVIDPLDEALWLGDWPRPLAPAEQRDDGDQAGLTASWDDLPSTVAALGGSEDQAEDQAVDLAPPLAELLSTEAKLMDWSASPTPELIDDRRWPAPTLSLPRKRRSSMAAVELPQW